MTNFVASSSWASRVALAAKALLEEEVLGALKAVRRRQGLRRDRGTSVRQRRAARSSICEIVVSFRVRTAQEYLDNVPRRSCLGMLVSMCR